MKHLYSFIFLICLISCEKKIDNSADTKDLALPQYSETGAYTFGFLYNDTVWTNFGQHIMKDDFGSHWITNSVTSEYEIAGTGNDKAYQISGELTIVQNNIPVKDISAGFSFIPASPFVKKYLLNGNYPTIFSLYNISTAKRYVEKLTNPFIIEVTKFDFAQNICSGRFNGVVYNEANASDSLIISDGRFDTKF